MASSSDPPDPYLAALRLLARRELSEHQIRQRLARKGCASDDIDEAIGRLRESRALDDERVAGAIARTQTAIKGRGKLRVRREIEQAGISKSVATRAVNDVFADLDPDALIAAALAKRLRGRTRIADEKELQRFYRYLIAQGFESDRVVRALSAKRRRSSDDR